MSPNIKLSKTLHEDEIIKLLCKTQINVYLDNETIFDLITRSYKSKSKDFRLHVIDYFKSDIDRFIKILTEWVDFNKSSLFIRSTIKINYCEVESPKNFIEESLVRLCTDHIDKLFKLLNSQVYKIRIFSLRSLIFILVRDKEKIFRDSFNNYTEGVIDFCINSFEDSLVKMEVCRFLGKINSKESEAMLEYFRDNEVDFTIRMVSIMGLDNIQKMNRSNINKDNSDIKSVILSYRR